MCTIVLGEILPQIVNIYNSSALLHFKFISYSLGMTNVRRKKVFL